MWNLWIAFSIVSVIVIIDQITKYYAVLYLVGDAAYTLIPGVLSLRYHENPGAAWGMLADQRWVFMLISSLAIVGIIGYLIWNRKEKLPPLFLVSLAMFVGGGIGNMIDRVVLGYVIDFFRFDFIDFPIFNVADSFITVAAVLMILYMIWESIQEWKAKKGPPKITENRNG